MSDVTGILSRIEAGDPQAGSHLLPLVYEELRKLATAKLAQENPGQTLQATALVHEAYLRLVGERKVASCDTKKSNLTSDDAYEATPTAGVWDSRGHFFAAAAEAMRRILVENARRKNRLKHGGEFARLDVELSDLPTRMQAEELIALDEALEKLRRNDPVKAQLVTLRYFAGLTIEQAAEILNISRVTAHRYWTFARAWLHHEIAGEQEVAEDQELIGQRSTSSKSG